MPPLNPTPEDLTVTVKLPRWRTRLVVLFAPALAAVACFTSVDRVCDAVARWIAAGAKFEVGA